MNPAGDGSPLIVRHGWGEMQIAGLGTGKDFKLWPGGGREWNWRETGTHHRPGIQPGDVNELIEHGARIVVLSRGRLLMLRTCTETIDLLRNHGIEYFVEETAQAAQRYNALAQQGEPVAGLFHSTC